MDKRKGISGAAGVAALIGMAGCASDGGSGGTVEVVPAQIPATVDVTTQAIGEEDGGITTPTPGAEPVTTLALGEEEGGSYAPGDGMATTLAIGEEDGGMPMPVEPDGGIGDGAGPIPGDPATATTLAYGEEG